MTRTHPLQQFWTLLASDPSKAKALLDPRGAWDDPLFDASTGPAAHETAIPRLAAWLAERRTERPPAHLRTTADDRRVIVEDVLTLKDGLIWNQAEQKSEKAPRFELATAVVGDLAPGGAAPYRSIRLYFSTWAVTGGASRVRKGPICPDERASTKQAMDAMPTIRKYFDGLAVGDAAMIELFEPDGYFREPANNFACGRDQLAAHFVHILKLGGVGIEFLTATREDDRIGIELQTVLWGTKKMPCPQAGLAVYELGPHGKLQGSRVYDSVVPPEL
jgi:hypothetical protein